MVDDVDEADITTGLDQLCCNPFLLLHWCIVLPGGEIDDGDC